MNRAAKRTFSFTIRFVETNDSSEILLIKRKKFGSQPLVERRVIYTTNDCSGFRLDPVALPNCQSTWQPYKIDSNTLSTFRSSDAKVFNSQVASFLERLARKFLGRWTEHSLSPVLRFWSLSKYKATPCEMFSERDSEKEVPLYYNSLI